MVNTLIKTLIIQSQGQPLPFLWLEGCLESVSTWCQYQGYEYQFYGDELFDFVDPALVEKFSSQKVIVTDLARLKAISNALHQGYDRVIWMDADFLIFSPDNFQLPELWQLPEGYMLGREVWVQAGSETDKKAKFKAHVKVHNAFLLFDRGNYFLDFYMSQAERFLYQCDGAAVPPQFIGPKLLTALHNVIRCPVFESAGMLSPDVVQDLLAPNHSGEALTLMLKKSPVLPSGANLCSSLADDTQLSEPGMHSLVEYLLARGLC